MMLSSNPASPDASSVVVEITAANTASSTASSSSSSAAAAKSLSPTQQRLLDASSFSPERGLDDNAINSPSDVSSLSSLSDECAEARQPPAYKILGDSDAYLPETRDLLDAEDDVNDRDSGSESEQPTVDDCSFGDYVSCHEEKVKECSSTPKKTYNNNNIEIHADDNDENDNDDDDDIFMASYTSSQKRDYELLNKEYEELRNKYRSRCSYPKSSIGNRSTSSSVCGSQRFDASTSMSPATTATSTSKSEKNYLSESEFNEYLDNLVLKEQRKINAGSSATPRPVTTLSPISERPESEISETDSKEEFLDSCRPLLEAQFERLVYIHREEPYFVSRVLDLLARFDETASRQQLLFLLEEVIAVHLNRRKAQKVDNPSSLYVRGRALTPRENDNQSIISNNEKKKNTEYFVKRQQYLRNIDDDTNADDFAEVNVEDEEDDDDEDRDEEEKEDGLDSDQYDSMSKAAVDLSALDTNLPLCKQIDRMPLEVIEHVSHSVSQSSPLTHQRKSQGGEEYCWACDKIATVLEEQFGVNEVSDDEAEEVQKKITASKDYAKPSYYGEIEQLHQAKNHKYERYNDRENDCKKVQANEKHVKNIHYDYSDDEEEAIHDAETRAALTSPLDKNWNSKSAAKAISELKKARNALKIYAQENFDDLGSDKNQISNASPLATEISTMRLQCEGAPSDEQIEHLVELVLVDAEVVTHVHVSVIRSAIQHILEPVSGAGNFPVRIFGESLESVLERHVGQKLANARTKVVVAHAMALDVQATCRIWLRGPHSQIQPKSLWSEGSRETVSVGVSSSSTQAAAAASLNSGADIVSAESLATVAYSEMDSCCDKLSKQIDDDMSVMRDMQEKLANKLVDLEDERAKILRQTRLATRRSQY